MTERAKEISTFRCSFGLYRFTTMPFGLKNAGACFQRVMALAMRGLSWQCCMAFIDDVIVYSHSWEEHLVDLRAVLQRVAEAKMTLNVGKCHFARNRLIYLGHIISKEGISADPRKVEAVQQFKPPADVPQMRSFLGLANHFEDS